jgi:hypothetical protein
MIRESDACIRNDFSVAYSAPLILLVSRGVGHLDIRDQHRRHDILRGRAAAA